MTPPKVHAGLPALAAQARTYRRGASAAVQRNRGFPAARPLQARDAPGAEWATEALFPGFFFARFDWRASLRLVQHARGVRSIVHFGERWPTIPDGVIEELRRTVGENELHTITVELAPGDAVQIAEGTLCGLRAVVSRVMPGRERVAVLMEFLGRQTTIEVPASFLVKEGEGRAEIL